ncbi:MAG: uncharacterized protein KVP18_003281 [Porospora cf. gigantea A]|uniref:uncharacterized protein n=1 Tax=Porospora cf. gigantea A TaxID=2853593 RepID=UPI00355A94B7|nr:MAG: hypothetical protein KVP18_003281 [Porospora cf. gigantea A]
MLTRVSPRATETCSRLESLVRLFISRTLFERHMPSDRGILVSLVGPDMRILPARFHLNPTLESWGLRSTTHPLFLVQFLEIQFTVLYSHRHQEFTHWFPYLQNRDDIDLFLGLRHMNSRGVCQSALLRFGTPGYVDLFESVMSVIRYMPRASDNLHRTRETAIHEARQDSTIKRSVRRKVADMKEQDSATMETYERFHSDLEDRACGLVAVELKESGEISSRLSAAEEGTAKSKIAKPKTQKSETAKSKTAEPKAARTPKPKAAKMTTSTSRESASSRMRTEEATGRSGSPRLTTDLTSSAQIRSFKGIPRKPSSVSMASLSPGSTTTSQPRFRSGRPLLSDNRPPRRGKCTDYLCCGCRCSPCIASSERDRSVRVLSDMDDENDWKHLHRHAIVGHLEHVGGALDRIKEILLDQSVSSSPPSDCHRNHRFYQNSGVADRSRLMVDRATSMRRPYPIKGQPSTSTTSLRLHAEHCDTSLDSLRVSGAPRMNSSVEVYRTGAQLSEIDYVGARFYSGGRRGDEVDTHCLRRADSSAYSDVFVADYPVDHPNEIYCNNEATPCVPEYVDHLLYGIGEHDLAQWCPAPRHNKSVSFKEPSPSATHSTSSGDTGTSSTHEAVWDISTLPALETSRISLHPHTGVILCFEPSGRKSILKRPGHSSDRPPQSVRTKLTLKKSLKETLNNKGWRSPRSYDSSVQNASFQSNPSNSTSSDVQEKPTVEDGDFFVKAAGQATWDIESSNSKRAMSLASEYKAHTDSFFNWGVGRRAVKSNLGDVFSDSNPVMEK